jgi:hypothetical protein
VKKYQEIEERIFLFSVNLVRILIRMLIKMMNECLFQIKK